MRRAGLLLGFCLLGCDALWVPFCLSEPQGKGCQLGYQAVPDYSLAYASQGWLLKPQPDNEKPAVPLDDYRQEILVNFEFGQTAKNSDKDPIVQEIYNDGTIEIMHDDDQTVAEIIKGIDLTFGVSQPISVPLRTIDLGCRSNVSHIALGYPRDNPNAPAVSWLGLRAYDGPFSFLISEADGANPLVPLREYKINSSVDIANGKLSTQMGCRPVVTKHFSFQSCQSRNANSGLYIIDSAVAASSLCNRPDMTELYCGKSERIFVISSAIDDSVAIIDGSQIYAFAINKMADTIKTTVPVLINEIDFEGVFLNDLNSDNYADLILLKTNGDVSVYLQNDAGNFNFSSQDSVNVKTALDRINNVDKNPVNTIVIGHVSSPQTVDLIVSKVGFQSNNLWLVSLDSNLPPPQTLQPGFLPIGAARLTSPFAEPPQRLELGDLNGDGQLDLVYVAKSAAYFCLTHVEK